MPTTLKRANVKVKVNGQFQDLGLLQSDISNQLADEIAERKTNDNNLEADKIPFPLNPHSKYGNPGDILRTDGEGGTKWVPVGQPTDEQTQDAINNWLDAHPEATTTVEDESLTYRKLVKGTLGFVTPEMFGAKGDGINDDTNAIRIALSSGFPIKCNGTYLITSLITINQANKIEIDGGKFLFNNNGQDDFLYITNTNKVILKNIEVICTDGGFTEQNSKGTFLATYLCNSVLIDNVKASNINFLYRANYHLTNDNTQYFMESIIINNVILNDCICPLLVSFCRFVSITNIKSESNSITRELVYIIGGIKNLVCDNIYANYSSRFYFHFNNVATGVSFDNTLRQNWVEHFTLLNSFFEKSNNQSIIDPMCPVGEITVVNVIGDDPIYRSGNFSGCICDSIYISNSEIGSPALDGGGNIKNVYFDNCTIKGYIAQGSTTYPVDISFKNCKLQSATLGLSGFASVYGKLTFIGCEIVLTNENSGQIIVTAEEITLINNIFNVIVMNRLIFNNQTSQKITAIGNRVNAKVYGSFIHQTPSVGIIKDNYINNTIVTDSVTKIDVTAISLNETTAIMEVGDTIDLIPTFTPNDTTNQSATHQISDNSVVSVTRKVINGQVGFEVKGLSAGTSTVTIRATDNTNIKATCDITVN